MAEIAIRALLTALAVAGTIAPLSVAGAQELLLKRVMLSTGGVGYFEHEAAVEGDAELLLDVRLDQVDDVLKSLVVFDSAGGVGAVRLPGRAPLVETFRDLPFEPEDLSSLVGLLGALAGEQIAVSGARALSGRLLGVAPETQLLPDGQGTVTRHRVSVVTEAGARQFLLEDADAVAFADPDLQAQVERALAATARHRVRDRRTLAIAAPGEGRRTVRVAYVVEAPLWKASYRLSSDPGGESGRLQGWAVLENMSGRDWDGVELALVSGNPVTFRQALYEAYYVERPEVPVEVLGRVLPRPDTGAVAARPEEAARLLQLEKESRAEAPAMRAMDEAVGGLPEAALMAAPPMPSEPAPPPLAGAAVAVAREEAATQVLFRVAQPLTVAAGDSVAVPIVDLEVAATRLSLYQPETHPLHPLAAVRLVNDTGTGLPPGALTLYERSADGATAYVGDARLATMPSGETRLLSFALDQKVRVDREQESSRRIVRGAISRGLLRLTVRERETTLYRIAAPAEEARTLLIEQPRRPDWELVAPDPARAEVTETHYRVPVALSAGEESVLEVALERPVEETVWVIDLPYSRLDAYASSSELAPELRAAFRRLAELRAEVDRVRERLDQVDRQRQEIVADQDRLRENLSSLPGESDLQRRYLDKLSAQEDEIERLDGLGEQLHAELVAAEARLADYVSELKV